MAEIHVSPVVRDIFADISNPPSRGEMSSEERAMVKEAIIDALYDEQWGRMGKSRFVVEGARVVCTSMEEYQSNSLMRKLTEEEREQNMAKVDPSRIGGRVETPAPHQIVIAAAFERAEDGCLTNHHTALQTNSEMMLDHMDIKFEPVFGVFEGLDAHDLHIASQAVGARGSANIVDFHRDALDSLADDEDACGKCKNSGDGKCDPDIEHLMWQDADEEVRMSGGGAGSDTLLKKGAYMFCHHGQGILYIEESGQHHFEIASRMGLAMQDPADALLGQLLARGVPFPDDWSDEDKMQFARDLLGDLGRLQGMDRTGFAFIFLSDPELAMHIRNLDQRFELLRLLMDNPDSRQWRRLVRGFLANEDDLNDLRNINNFEGRWFDRLTFDAQIILTYIAAKGGANFHDWYTFMASSAWLQLVRPATLPAPSSSFNPKQGTQVLRTEIQLTRPKSKVPGQNLDLLPPPSFFLDKSGFLDRPVENGTTVIGTGKKPHTGAFNIDKTPPVQGVRKGDATVLSIMPPGSQAKIIQENPYGWNPLHPKITSSLKPGGRILITAAANNPYLKQAIETLDEKGWRFTHTKIRNTGQFTATGGRTLTKPEWFEHYEIIVD